jgi:hypothetical protein
VPSVQGAEKCQKGNKLCGRGQVKKINKRQVLEQERYIKGRIKCRVYCTHEAAQRIDKRDMPKSAFQDKTPTPLPGHMQPDNN